MSFIASEPAESLIQGTGAESSPAEVTFLFPGHGSQYVGMGRQLYATEPAFRQAIDRCNLLLGPLLPQPLLAALDPAPGQISPLHETVFAEPAIFAVSYALAQLWRSWGVEPAWVVGHGVGEYVAACIAGVLNLEDALHLVTQRSRLVSQLSSEAAAAVVTADESAVAALLGPDRRFVDIAAVDGPTQTVLAGRRDALGAVLGLLRARGVPVQPLERPLACHSPQVEPILAELEAIAAPLAHAPPQLGWVSTVTAAPMVAGRANARYWVQQARQPVRYEAAVRAVRARGCRLFVEAGPGRNLADLGERLFPSGERWLASLCPGRDETRQILESLAQLYVAGSRVDWSGLESNTPHRRIALPTYPFQRRRFWWELPAGSSARAALGAPGDEWLYELRWQPAERSATAGAADGQPGRWVIFAGEGAMIAGLARRIEARGQSYVTVRAGSGFQELAEGVFTVDPAHPEDWERLVSRLLAPSETPCRGLVHCWSQTGPATDPTNQDGWESSQAGSCGSVLHLVQALIKTGGTSLPRLWLVTRGAQAVVPAEQELAPAQAPVWGLGRVIRFEHPEIWGGAIDLDPVYPGDQTKEVLEEIWHPQGQDELAFRGGRRFAARLVRSPAGGCAAPKPAFRPDRTYLITGGLGSLGQKITGWLIEHGAKHLILTARSEPTAAARENIATWEHQGAQIAVTRADVADRNQLAAVLESARQSLPSLAGVIHAAGVLDDGVLLMQNWGRFAKVMAPKVAGAWNLHRLTEALELDFFVLFSSMASMLGSPGQGNYAAANTFLDALAHFRRARGLPAVSINWGAWADVGMAAELARRSPMQRTPDGLTAIPLDRGLAVLGRLVAGAPPQIGVLPVEWKAFLRQFSDGERPPVLDEMARDIGPCDLSAPAQPRSELLERLDTAPVGERHGLVVDHIRATVARIMGLDKSHAPEPQQGFFDMGLDSLMAIELKNSLVASLGRTLPATVVFQHPNIDALAGYVINEVLKPTVSEPLNGGPTPPAAAALGLDGLSEDELLALLAEEVGTREDRGLASESRAASDL